jgi:hypothetical protein
MVEEIPDSWSSSFQGFERAREVLKDPKGR